MKHLIRSLIVFALLAASYSGAWFYTAKEINKAIEQFYYQDAPAMGIEFLGEKPILTGFPAIPTINYEGGFRTPDITITFDHLRITGFPVPQLPISFEIPNTFIIQSNDAKRSFYLDYLLLTATVPSEMPNSSKKNDISLWQRNIGKIDIEHFVTIKNNMTLYANGNIGLDKELQPTFQMNSNITGYEELIKFFVQYGNLKPLPASIATSALNALAKENPETGVAEVTLLAHLQNRTFYLGPVRITEAPYIEWSD